MLKPGDFFIGIIDLFAILLPGALLVLIATTSTVSTVPGLVELLIGFTGAKGSFAFFATSYIVGHMVATLGGPLDHPADYVARTLERKHAKAIRTFARDSMSALLPKSEEFAGKLGFLATYARLKNSVAASEIDRLQAISRLFRSLVVVFPVGFLLLKPEVQSQIPPLARATVLLLAIWLFGYQRWKRQLSIHTSFVALACCRELR